MTVAGVEWRFEIDGDVDAPGWVLLPTDLDPSERDRWLDEAVASLLGELGPDDVEGAPIQASELREDLMRGLALRDESPTTAVFQVWPLPLAASVLCHVDVLASRGLPDWSQLDDVTVHSIDVPSLGVGLQAVARHEDELGGGERLDLTSLHLVFDDGETTLMLSLGPAPDVLVGAATTGLAVLTSALTLQGDDGRTFAGRRDDTSTDDAWPTDVAS